MVIRKYWRHLCLTFAAFFWSSCGDDGNSVTPSDNGGAVVPPAESSADVAGESSSSEETLEVLSSSSQEPVRDTGVITLFSDPSVTCEKDAKWIMFPIYALGRKSAGSCEDIRILVEKGSAYSKEELEEMEASLEDCRNSLCEPVALYGVISQPPIVGTRTRIDVTYNCSNRERYYSSYNYSVIEPENPGFPRDEDNILYLTEEEYNTAKLSRASMAKAAPRFEPEPDSSDSEETVSPECDRMGFVEVDEIYEAASKTLYAKYADELANDSLSEDRRNFLNQVCDEQNSTIRKDILPEYDYYENLSFESQCSLKGWLDESIWFSGYIARYQKRPDGTVEETERYREKFSAILNKLEEVIESKYKPKSDDSDMMS